MAQKRWAVGAILAGQMWEDMTKTVFNTYEAASSHVDALNRSKRYSSVILQDERYFKMA